MSFCKNWNLQSGKTFASFSDKFINFPQKTCSLGCHCFFILKTIGAKGHRWWSVKFDFSMLRPLLWRKIEICSTRPGRSAVGYRWRQSGQNWVVFFIFMANSGQMIPGGLQGCHFLFLWKWWLGKQVWHPWAKGASLWHLDLCGEIKRSFLFDVSLFQRWSQEFATAVKSCV